MSTFIINRFIDQGFTIYILAQDYECLKYLTVMLSSPDISDCVVVCLMLAVCMKKP